MYSFKQEIAPCGGKIIFHSETSGRSVIKYTHSRPTPASVFVISVARDGWDIVPPGGQSSSGITVYMLSDVAGMWGKICPQCHSYFRTDYALRDMTCPYCSHVSHILSFTTPTQIEYVEAYCKAYIEASSKNIEAEVDLDSLVDNLAKNKVNPWVITEEKQQTTIHCKCGVTYDILGDYGVCPRCKKPNAREKVEQKLDTIIAELKDRKISSAEALRKSISAFEAMSKDLRNRLLRLSMTPKRRSQIEKINFQNIINACENLDSYFGFDCLSGINPECRTFINLMTNKRHVIVHYDGKIDQVYLDRTGDNSFKLNETIEIQAHEVFKLIPLIKTISVNLIHGYESITSK